MVREVVSGISKLEENPILRILDAGCGTGLSGPLLKPYASRLVGVDLSENMLNQARARRCFDEFACMNLVDYLERSIELLDVVASVDTLVYFGALDAVFSGVSRVLKPGGLLLFTLEKADDGAMLGYVLGPHGRYAHSRAYVTSALSEAGLRLIVLDEQVIRKELGQPVNGWIVTAGKPG